jgi:arabinofuranosyltransferase
MVVRVPLSRTLAPRHLAASAALVVLAGWSVIAAVSLRIPYEEAVSEDGLADERGVYVVLSGHHNPIELDDYMTMSLGWPQEGASWHQLAENDPRALLIEDERYPLDPTIDATIRLAVLTWNIGLSGYAAGTDVHVADRYGLADPLASRMRLEVRGRPGHEKQLDPIWAIARFGSATDATGDVVAARTALACGDIAEQLAAIEEPLTTGRFLDNLFVALRLRDLSIPSDPEEAIAEYC